jgi:hypothetical protein
MQFLKRYGISGPLKWHSQSVNPQTLQLLAERKRRWHILNILIFSTCSYATVIWHLVLFLKKSTT